MAANLEKIVDDLSVLTVIEAAELSKMLEEKWGVSAAAPVAVAAVADAGAGAEALASGAGAGALASGGGLVSPLVSGGLSSSCDVTASR